MRTMLLELSPALEKRVQEEARRRGVSAPEVVRDTLEESLLPAAKHDIMEFAGAGREALAGVDVDEYIRQEREDWDTRNA